MRSITFVALAILAAACAPAEPGAVPIVIRGATLLDGNGGPPLRDAVVVVTDGRIAAVGPRDAIAIPRGARVEDAAGHYLLPGLIDVHAHALVPRCEPTPEGVRQAGFDWTLSARLMRTLLRFGITTARSPATPTVLGLAMRDSLAAGRVLGPRLLVAGELITGARTTPDAVRAEVRAQAALGVDYIKLYSQLGPDAVRAGIEEAHGLGLQVIGHLQRTTWTEGLDAGIDALTHAAPWSEELLDAPGRARHALARARRGEMRARIDWLEALDTAGQEVAALATRLAEAGVPLDPTLVAFDTKFSRDTLTGRPVGSRYRQNPHRDAVPGLRATWDACGVPTDSWTADDFRRAERAWPVLLGLVRQYHVRGVLLTAGSDTPNPWVIPGEGLHRELELLVDAGIPPAAVLRIATRNGAASLGLLAETGTVEPGKRADLLLLRADPLARISNTRQIAWVMQGGTRYRPETLATDGAQPR